MSVSDQTRTSAGSADEDQPRIEDFPPAGIKPQIGERLQLRLQGGGSLDYVTAQLIGYIRGRSILVSAPEAAEQRAGMTEGRQVEVRMLTGGNIYAFQTGIQRLCVSPMHYLHLDWPLGVRVQELRKSPWARVDLAASVALPGQAEEYAHIRNLSPDGAQFEAPAAVGAVGDALRLSFHVDIDGQRSALALSATIQHVHPPRKAEGMREYGVEFRDLQPQEALLLRCLVYQRIAAGFLA
jgi:hypothetical protein